MSDNDRVIEVQGLTKSFGRTRALDGLDQRFDTELWRKLIDADILSTAAPESVGGGGFGTPRLPIGPGREGEPQAHHETRGMLTGEALLDNVEFRSNGGANLVTNGTFEAGDTQITMGQFFDACPPINYDSSPGGVEQVVYQGLGVDPLTLNGTTVSDTSSEPTSAACVARPSRAPSRSTRCTQVAPASR